MATPWNTRVDLTKRCESVETVHIGDGETEDMPCALPATEVMVDPETGMAYRLCKDDAGEMFRFITGQVRA